MQRDAIAPRTVDEFDGFFAREFDAFVSHALKLGAQLDEARDIVSEVMLQVYSNWPRLASPRKWARRAVLTTLIKSRQRDRQGIERAIRGGHLVLEGEQDPGFNIWEDSQWVQQMLAVLPPAQREVMEMATQSLTPTEIAILLGKNPATIRANLFKARAAMIAELQRRESYESTKNGRSREEIR